MEAETHQELRDLQRQVARLSSRMRLLYGTAALAAVGGVLLWAPLAASAPDAPNETVYDDLYWFAANTPAVAAEVNSNFSTLHAMTDTNASDISALQTDKLDKTGGVVSGNLDIDGRLDVGTSGGTAIQLFDDADITGADLIQGYNDLRLAGDAVGGADLVIEADGDVNVTNGRLRAANTQTTGWCGCYNHNHWGTFDGNNAWATCNAGYFVAGIFKSTCDNLHCIEEIRCCRPCNLN